jgi:excisionase family DNA binding protein
MVEVKEELLTVAEAAALLKVSRHTIYRWIAEGRLPAVRYSRRIVRLRRRDLEQSPGRSQTQISETKSPYKAASNVDEEAERAEVKRLIDRYRELVNRPRGPNEPRKGSAEALLRHLGVISKEEGEELRRVIREAKTYSPPVDLD